MRILLFASLVEIVGVPAGEVEALIAVIRELGGDCLVDAPTGDANAQVAEKAPAGEADARLGGCVGRGTGRRGGGTAMGDEHHRRVGWRFWMVWRRS